MSEKRYLATLTTEEEKLLRDIMNRGKHGARKHRRAQALLCAYEGCTNAMAADRTGSGGQDLLDVAVISGWLVTLEYTDTRL